MASAEYGGGSGLDRSSCLGRVFVYREQSRPGETDAEARRAKLRGTGLMRVREVGSGLGRSVPIRAAAVTAYAPEYDTDGRIAQAAQRIIETLLSAAGGS